MTDYEPPLNPSCGRLPIMYIAAYPGKKSRVLRDLTVPLLPDAEDAWARHRRPWPRAATTGGLSSSSSSSKRQRKRAPARAGATKTTASTRQREKACRLASVDRNGRGLPPSPASKRPPCLDSGAGPRKFWEAMAGPRLVDARWNLDVKVGRCT